MDIYNNIHSFVNFVSTVAGRSSCSDGSEDGRSSFYGTDTLSEALDLFAKGYNEPLKDFKDFFINCKNAYECKNILINDYRGSRPNIGRYLRGLPRQMKRYKKERSEQKSLSIYVDVSVAGIVSINEKIAYGKKIISIINSAQNKGINLEIFAGIINGDEYNSKNPNSAIAIKIKDFSEPLNLLQMCFPLCHPAFYRRFHQIVFTHAYAGKKSWGCSRPAYGTAIDCQKYVEDSLGKNSIYISFTNVDKVIKKFNEK